MKKLGHLGVFILLVFLSVYLPELGVVHLTKFLRWGDRWLFYYFSSKATSSFRIIYLLAQKEKDALYF